MAFNAYHTVEKSYVDYELVRFDSVGLNAGNHFQLSTNVFICPVNGIYGFSFSLYNKAGLGVECNIKKEKGDFVNVWADNTENTSNAASGFGTIDCNRGDRVYVEVGGTSDSPIFGNDRVHLSGFLIYRFD